MKSVPVSKIDALIASLESELEETKAYILEDRVFAQTIIQDHLEQVRGLKKESEEMIPLSTVEAFLKWMESFHDMVDHQYRDITGAVIMHIKEDLLPTEDKKKELTKDKEK